MRLAITLLHRWLGLATAAFLFVSGLTGAVISWDHELDHLLNAHLMEVESDGPALSPYDLARMIEERDPRVQVTFVPLAAEPGEAMVFGVDPRIDPATGDLFEPGYNEVFVDPATGAEVGRRDWGAAWPITGENLVSFLYVLHYSLHIPQMWGIDSWGVWLMGIVAVVWTFDCFFGFYLTLPVRRAAGAGRPEAVERQLARGWWARWKPAWRIKTRGSPYRINFDIHRAFGLWFWPLLFVLAFTAFSLNLYREVFYPLMATVSEVTPSPFDLRERTPPDEPIAPDLDFREAVALASAEAARRGWADPAGVVSYVRNFGIYNVRFFGPGEGHGMAGVGPPVLFLDGRDGHVLGERRPWTGTAADIFVQAQFPLHSGRILGLPGRIIVSVTGLAVAALSVTGVVIWYRKRAAREAVKRGRRAPQRVSAPAE